jgi:pilus assembly protein CpaC
MLHVKIAELNRSALRQIGVSWMDVKNHFNIGSLVGGGGSLTANGTAAQSASIIPSAFGRGILPTPGSIQPLTNAYSSAGNFATGTNTQLYGIFNAGQFNIFINALRQNSLAKVLAEPNLMTLDGMPAHFLAGGSFPFAVP